jgi:hypothetical protein
MDNKTSEIILYSEDIIKTEITNFLNLFKNSYLHSDSDYIRLLNGCDINNIKGFIQLKEAIYNIMKKKCHSGSKALQYIQNNRRLKDFNYSCIVYGIEMYDFQAIRNKILEYTPYNRRDGVDYIKDHSCDYKIKLTDFITNNNN